MSEEEPTGTTRLVMACPYKCGACIAAYVNARDKEAMESAAWSMEVAWHKHLAKHYPGGKHAVRR